MAMALARTRGRDDVMTSSVPGSATRFRSPTPKVTGGRGEPTMASQVVKRSRRTKSQESHEREPQRLNLKTEYKDKESVAASIWQSFGKDVEKMRHEELVSKFKLLLNEHMKLEKFLSFCLREHEISKNQMECELLDAMIYIEDLKKALETKLARKNRVMPVEAEERRALIRQNKKLLKQLYETAKKVEKLEAVNDEQKEQLEVMEFQVMEAENHRIVMDEIIRQHGLTEKPVARVSTAVQVKMLSNDELAVKRELSQLRSQNAELRRQLQIADDENSLAESDMGAVKVVENMKVQLAQKDNLLRELEDRIKGLQKQVDTAKRQAAIMQRHVVRQSENSRLNTGGRKATEDNEEEEDDDDATENDPTESFSESLPEGHERREAEGEEAGGAMAQLIRASFFPLVAVPVQDQALPFKERLPQIMQERKDDKLLMETIRTFQRLVDEREAEIGDLKGRLKEMGAYSATNRDDLAREVEDLLNSLERQLADSGLLDEKQMELAEGLSLAPRMANVQNALSRISSPEKLEEVNRDLRERLEKMEAEKDGIIAQVREANLVLQKNLEAMEQQQEAMKPELEALNAEKERLQREVSEIKRASFQLESKTASQLDQCSLELEALKQEKEELLQKISSQEDTEKNLENLQVQNQALVKKISDSKALEGELEALKVEKEELLEIISAQEDIEKDLENLEVQNQALVKKVSDSKTLEGELEALKIEKEELLEKVSAQKDMEKDLENLEVQNQALVKKISESKTLEGELEALKVENMELLASLISSEPKEEQIKAVKVEKDDAGAKDDSLEALKTENKDLMAKISELEEKEKDFDVLKVQNMELLAFKVALEDKEKDVGSLKVQNKELLAANEALLEKEKNFGALKVQHEELDIAKKALEEKEKDLDVLKVQNKELMTANDSLKEKDKDFGVLKVQNMELLAAKEALEKKDKDLGVLKIQNMELLAAKEALEAQQKATPGMQQLQERLDRLANERDALQATCNSLKERANLPQVAVPEEKGCSLHADLDLAVAHNEALRTRMATLSSQLEASEARSQRLAALLAELERKLGLESISLRHEDPVANLSELLSTLTRPDRSRRASTEDLVRAEALKRCVTGKGPLSASDRSKLRTEAKSLSEKELGQRLAQEASAVHKKVFPNLKNREAVIKAFWDFKPKTKADPGQVGLPHLHAAAEELPHRCKETAELREELRKAREAAMRLQGAKADPHEEEEPRGRPELLRAVAERWRAVGRHMAVSDLRGRPTLQLVDAALQLVEAESWTREGRGLGEWRAEQVRKGLELLTAEQLEDVVRALRAALLPRIEAEDPAALRHEADRLGALLWGAEGGVRRLEDAELPAEVRRRRRLVEAQLAWSKLAARPQEDVRRLLEDWELLQGPQDESGEPGSPEEVLARFHSGTEAFRARLLAEVTPEDDTELAGAAVAAVAELQRLGGGVELSDRELEALRTAMSAKPAAMQREELFLTQAALPEAAAQRGSGREAAVRFAAAPKLSRLPVERKRALLREWRNVARLLRLPLPQVDLERLSDSQTNEALFSLGGALLPALQGRPNEQEALRSAVEQLEVGRSQLDGAPKPQGLEGRLRRLPPGALEERWRQLRREVAVRLHAGEATWRLPEAALEAQLRVLAGAQGAEAPRLEGLRKEEKVARLAQQKEAAAAAILTANWGRPEALAQQVELLGGGSSFLQLPADQRARRIRHLLQQPLMGSREGCVDAILALERFCEAAVGRPEGGRGRLEALSDAQLAAELRAAQEAFEEAVREAGAPPEAELEARTLEVLAAQGALKGRAPSTAEKVDLKNCLRQMPPDLLRRIHAAAALSLAREAPGAHAEGGKRSQSPRGAIQRLAGQLADLEEVAREVGALCAAVGLPEKPTASAGGLLHNLAALKEYLRSCLLLSPPLPAELRAVLPTNQNVLPPRDLLRLLERRTMQAGAGREALVADILALEGRQRAEPLTDEDLEEARVWLREKSEEELVEMREQLRRRERGGAEVRKDDGRSSSEPRSSGGTPELRKSSGTPGLRKSATPELRKNGGTPELRKSSGTPPELDLTAKDLRAFSKEELVKLVARFQKAVRDNLEAGTSQDTGSMRNLLKGKAPTTSTEMLERIQQLERDNRRWKSHVEHMGRSENDLLSTIAGLEESLRDAQARDSAELKSALLSGEARSPMQGAMEGERNVRYYSMQLQDIHYQAVIDQLRRKLELDTKKRREVERRLDDLMEAERRGRKEKEAVEARLATAKRMESALKKRLELLEAAPGEPEALCPHNTKIVELESEITTLSEHARSDQAKLHGLGVRLSEMEAVNRAYMDRIHELEMRDLAANKKMLRLQATYEDMMREYSDVKAQDSTWRKRAKAYESMEASLAQTKASYEAVLKRMEEEVARLNGSVQRLSSDNDKLRERCNEYATKMRDTQTNAMAIAGELEAHRRGNQNSLDRLSAASAKNHLMESRLRESEEEKARAERRLRIVEDQKAALLVESSNMQLTNQDVTRQLNAARASCEALKEELEVISCRQNQAQRQQDDLLLERLEWERKVSEFEREERSLKRRLQQHEDAESKLKQKVLMLESKLTGGPHNTNAKPAHRNPADVEEVLENTGHLQDQIHFLKSTCDSQSAEISRLRSHILTLEGDLAESQATYIPPPGFMLVTQGEIEKMRRKSVASSRSPNPTSDC